MCGIVGLYLKNPEWEARLGEMLSDMLIQMTDRGPDSAGVALYHESVAADAVKMTLQGPDNIDWDQVSATLQEGPGAPFSVRPLANHAVVTGQLGEDADVDQILGWLDDRFAELRVTSIGSVIEIYKEKGLPAQVIDRFAIRRMGGTHALGHTRMATESAVTTAHSHPFSTGRDLCLVHNGSLSNHNRWRQKLRTEGVRFQTDNDSEVAAGYLTWRLGQGATLKEALEAALEDLDGFYTFAIGTRNGFAVLRDPIACKPAILAETDDWVAMASEYRAIGQLPGSHDARIWEPDPATIYSWEKH